MKYRIFPADKNGRFLKGFCPTLCEDNDLDCSIYELMVYLSMYNVEYDHIVTLQYE